MYSRRLALVFTFVLLLSLALTGCSARPGQGELAANATSDQLVVDIPALTVEFNDAGEAMMGGANLSQILPALGASLPAALSFTPEEIQKLTDAGVQSVFINVTPDAFNWYINGQPLPALDWDPETLGSLQEVVGIVGADNADTLGAVVPLLGNMSLGVALKFPGADSAAPLVGAVDEAAVKQASANAFNQALAGLGIPPFAVGFLQALPPLTINFAADGKAELTGLPPMLMGFLPPDALAGLNQSPEALKPVTDLGIESISVKTSPETLNLAINGSALPPITWGSGEFTNLIELGVGSGLLTKLTGADLSALEQLNQFLPILQNSKIDLTVNFAKP